MAATMNSMLGNLNKIPVYINECKELNIQVLRPDINESYSKFAVINGSIRFTLTSIKNVGENAIEEIIKNRKQNGAFKSFIDFCERVASESVNKKCVESLIKAGCFDELEKEYTRFDLLDNYEKMMDGVNQTRRNNYANQMNFFETENTDNTSQLVIIRSQKKPSKKELLDMEKEMLGLYVSGHPLDEYLEYIDKYATVTSQELNIEESEEETLEEEMEKKDYDGKMVTFCGIISHTKVFITKSNTQMLFAQIEDRYGSVELVVFPNIYQKYSSLLAKDQVVKIVGKVSMKENEKTKIIVNEVELITKQVKIYIRIPKDKFDLEPRVISFIKSLEESRGSNPVYLFYEGTNKVKLLSREFCLNSQDETIHKLKMAFGDENVKLK